MTTSPRVQRRQHDRLDVLGLVSGVEQGFGAVVEVAGLGAEHDPAHLLADQRVAGLEGQEHGIARRRPARRGAAATGSTCPNPRRPRSTRRRRCRCSDPPMPWGEPTGRCRLLAPRGSGGRRARAVRGPARSCRRPASVIASRLRRISGVVLVEDAGQQLRAGAEPRQRVRGDSASPVNRTPAEGISQAVWPAGVAGRRDRHQGAGDVEADTGGHRRDVGQRHGCLRQDRAEGLAHPAPSRAMRALPEHLHRRDLLEVLPPSVAGLLLPRQHRHVVPLAERGDAAHVVEVRVGQHDRPDVLRPPPDRVERREQRLRVVRVAGIDQRHRVAVGDQGPVDVGAGDQVHLVVDPRELHGSALLGRALLGCRLLRGRLLACGLLRSSSSRRAWPPSWPGPSPAARRAARRRARG